MSEINARAPTFNPTYVSMLLFLSPSRGEEAWTHLSEVKIWCSGFLVSILGGERGIMGLRRYDGVITWRDDECGMDNFEYGFHTYWNVNCIIDDWNMYKKNIQIQCWIIVNLSIHLDRWILNALFYAFVTITPWSYNFQLEKIKLR